MVVDYIISISMDNSIVLEKIKRISLERKKQKLRFNSTCTHMFNIFCTAYELREEKR